MEKRKKNRTVGYKIISFFVMLAALVAIFGAGWFFGTRNDSGISPEFPIDSATDEDSLYIHFIDVGQGDCTFIRFPDKKTMLIDGGDGTKTNNRKIADYFTALDVKKIDYLLLTHGDVDHCGGLESILDSVEVNCAYMPYEATVTSEEKYASLYAKVCKKAKAVNISGRYDCVYGENYFLTLLSPKSSVSADEAPNENSAVAWLSYAGTNVLFAGDMTERTERMLMKEYLALGEDIFDPEIEGTGERKRVNLTNTAILKVAHHGSDSSSSEEWLKFLNYKTAVISCGVDNDYGHPAPTTIANLKSANPDGEIYRTDECGDIAIAIGKDGKYSVVYKNQARSDAAENENSLLEAAYVCERRENTYDFRIF